MLIKDFKACELEKLHGIYEIRNTSSNKIYVGSAVNLNSRRRDHTDTLRRGAHHNRHLQRAFNKYGGSSFVFSVLEFVEDKTRLIEREQYYIDTLKPDYNILPTAGSLLGFKFSGESKRKMSESRKGIVMSEETRRKMSAWQIGRINSEEYKRKQRAIQKGRKGRPHSEEEKRKISESNKGKVIPEEQRQRSRYTQSFPVVMLSLKGDFIRNFSDAREVSELLGLCASCVQNCCRGEQLTHKGYKFVYKKNYE